MISLVTGHSDIHVIDFLKAISKFKQYKSQFKIRQNLFLV